MRKKITNHSGRKTLVKKLKAAQVPESSIIKVTGHTTEQGLRSYDPEDEGEYRGMSNIIQGEDKAIDFNIISPLGVNQQSKSTKQSSSSVLHPPTTASPATLFNPFTSFVSILEEQKENVSYDAAFRPFSFAYCKNITLNFNHPSSSSSSTAAVSNTKKRKRLIIYSSSEDELSQN